MVELAKMILKYLGYGFIISIYGVFAWYGKVSVDSFVMVLSAALGALGMSHAMAPATSTPPPFLVETPAPQPDTTIINRS